jgi:HemK-related putative methylase
MFPWNYVKVIKHPKVYSPQEDTWFLTDILVQQIQIMEFLDFSNPIVCEIGSGTGFISIILSKNFPYLNFICIDISSKASELSYINLREHISVKCFDTLCSDLLQALNPSKFSPTIIYFNPPYLKTKKEEQKSKKDLLVRSWDGGETGVNVIESFLENLTKFSFNHAFFLSSILNENEIFEKRFKKQFKFQIIAEKKIESDKLLCYHVQNR